MAVARYYSSNAIDTTLSVGISSSDLSMTVASTAGFPSSYPYTLAIDYDTSSEELVDVTYASSTVLTITRAVDGTTAQSHSASAPIKHVISGRDMREAQEHYNATGYYSVANGATTENFNLHGLGSLDGNVVGTDKTQTLTAKTLTSPAINGATLGGTTTLSGTISANSTTITATELGYIDGATSNLQTQINAKAPIASPTFTGTVTLPNNTGLSNPNLYNPTLTGTLTATGAEITGSTLNGTTTLIGTISANSKTITATELGYVDGVTSNIQTQLDSKLPSASIQSGKGTTSSTADGATSTTAISFSTAFTTAPIVTVTPVRSFSSATPKIQLTVSADATTTGFSVFFTNNSGVTLALPFNWIAVGS